MHTEPVTLISPMLFFTVLIKITFFQYLSKNITIVCCICFLNFKIQFGLILLIQIDLNVTDFRYGTGIQVPISAWHYYNDGINFTLFILQYNL